MKTCKSIYHNKSSKHFLSLMLLAVSMTLISAPVQAGFIELSFGATISNDGGTTTDNITGQFTLDTSVFFGIDVGAVNNTIVSGEATLLGSLETVNAGSGFTFSAAATRTGFGLLNIIGDYGSGSFSLDLASANFFTGTDVFDDLTTDLMLASLMAFSPAEALGTTRFANLAGHIDEWEGALTFLQVRAIPEPSTMWLFLLAVPGVLYWRRRM